MKVYNAKQGVKICNLSVGDTVRVADADGVVQPELFLICAVLDGQGRTARHSAFSNLYGSSDHLFLVSLSTGRARQMPHLSTRVEKVENVAVVTNFCENPS